MPSSTLLDNLSSGYLAARSALLPKNAAQEILVYVESDEDIAFWKNILKPYETKKIKFDIQLPIKNALEKGKVAALKLDVGPYLIVCIDSDYDYLLQDTTEQSRRINDSDFIFQTYSYSIENLLCYSPSLDLLCTQSTQNNNQTVDLEALLKSYSQIIYPLFLWSFHFNIKQDMTSFPLFNFCETIKILDSKIYKIENFIEVLEKLKLKIKTKIQVLEQQFPDEVSHVQSLSEQLKTLGVNPENTYLFAQGHTIKDNVVLMFLKPICSGLQREKEQQIKNNAKHPTAIADEFRHYKNLLIPIEVVLNMNTEFKSCFLYQKIQDDLDNYIQQLNQ